MDEQFCDRCGEHVGGDTCRMCDYHTAETGSNLCGQCKQVVAAVEEDCARRGCTCHPEVSVVRGYVLMTHEDGCVALRKRMAPMN